MSTIRSPIVLKNSTIRKTKLLYYILLFTYLYFPFFIKYINTTNKSIKSMYQRLRDTINKKHIKLRMIVFEEYQHSERGTRTEHKYKQIKNISKC
jgi:hypothetical protein